MQNKRLTNSEELFINYILQGLKTPDAVRKAYPECKYPSQYGYQLLRKNYIKDQIQQRNFQQLESGVSIAINKLIELVNDKKAPKSVQLSASCQLLDRNNYSGTSKSEVINKIENLSEQELELQLNTILNQLGINKNIISH
tara:strand:+ start:7460 stop:7882 length:423 start_codon:yes stop_codon:yes gene_type:complete